MLWWREAEYSWRTLNRRGITLNAAAHLCLYLSICFSLSVRPSQFLSAAGSLCLQPRSTLCGDLKLKWASSSLSSALPSGNAALLTLQAAVVRVGGTGTGPVLLEHADSIALSFFCLYHSFSKCCEAPAAAQSQQRISPMLLLVFTFCCYWTFYVKAAILFVIQIFLSLSDAIIYTAYCVLLYSNIV